MTAAERLDRSFFNRPVLQVTRDLLGKRLAGIIVEAEAYRGEEDLACQGIYDQRGAVSPRYWRDAGDRCH